MSSPNFRTHAFCNQKVGKDISLSSYADLNLLLKLSVSQLPYLRNAVKKAATSQSRSEDQTQGHESSEGCTCSIRVSYHS